MIYQNPTVDSDKLILGNVKIETAAAGTTVLGAWVNLGAGIVNDSAHIPERYTSQAGNAPDPLEGVADETATLSGEMIEFDGSVLSAIHCGLITVSTTSSVQTIHAGGNTILTPRAFRITNTRTISGNTVSTVLTLYKGTLDAGLAFNFKSDNDTDPVAVMPFAITAKINAALEVGYQLYNITRDTP